jgi:hypothetical protein
VITFVDLDQYLELSAGNWSIVVGRELEHCGFGLYKKTTARYTFKTLLDFIFRFLLRKSMIF